MDGGAFDGADVTARFGGWGDGGESEAGFEGHFVRVMLWVGWDVGWREVGMCGVSGEELGMDINGLVDTVAL